VQTIVFVELHTAKAYQSKPAEIGRISIRIFQIMAF